MRPGPTLLRDALLREQIVVIVVSSPLSFARIAVGFFGCFSDPKTGATVPAAVARPPARLFGPTKNLSSARLHGWLGARVEIAVLESALEVPVLQRTLPQPRTGNDSMFARPSHRCKPVWLLSSLAGLIRPADGLDQ